MKTISASVALLAAVATAYDQINITLNGAQQTLYLQNADWAKAPVYNKSSVSMSYNSLAYLSWSS